MAKIETIQDLIEEAKLRFLWWTICIFSLTYFLSHTSKSMWMNVPIAGLIALFLRYLATEVEFRWKDSPSSKPTRVTYPAKSRISVNGSRLSTVPSKWRRKFDSPVVEAAVEDFVNKIIQDFVTDLWYSDLTPDKEAPDLMRVVILEALGEVAGRIKEVNIVDLLTRKTQASIGVDVMVTLSSEERDEKLKQQLMASKSLHPALVSSESEYKYLQRLVAGLLGVVLKPREAQCPLVRCIAREFVTCLVVQPIMTLGVIPSTLGSCIALDTLYMNGNFFQGTIPSALEKMTGLRTLDLSLNNLSGKIPHFLVRLPLTMLNLSYNNLEGEVPSGGVFNNATGVSLFGNSRLCGGITQLKLHNCSFDQTRIKRRSHRKRLLLEIFFGCAAVILLVIFILAYMFWSRKRTVKTEVAGNSENFRSVSYQSILKATNGLSVDNLIGRGNFGTVYKGAIDQDGPTVAIKIFNLGNHYASKSFIAECKALRSIRHRNLIKVITVCSSVDYQGNDFKALVYEYMVNGSLDDWLHPTGEISMVRNEENVRGSLSFRQRLEIAVDVAFALEYLHHYCDPSVIHCDLKPSNVLLDEDMVAHVGDLGLAKLISEVISSSSANQSSFTGVRGTVGYAPPEYGMGNEVSASGDVYSFGILVLEMFTGKRPTDDIFREGISLHEYVKAALFEQDIKIVDDALLHDMALDNNNSPIVFQAVVSVLETALSCSAELPQERPDMNTVAVNLSSIRNKLQ